MDIETVIKAIMSELYEISLHAERERRNDDLLLADIENAVLTGEIIEEYLDDPRGQSCLISGNTTDGTPVHLVVGFLPGYYIRIITVYIPDPSKWEANWKIRRKE